MGYVASSRHKAARLRDAADFIKAAKEKPGTLHVAQSCRLDQEPRLQVSSRPGRRRPVTIVAFPQLARCAAALLSGDIQMAIEKLPRRQSNIDDHAVEQQ